MLDTTPRLPTLSSGTAVSIAGLSLLLCLGIMGLSGASVPGFLLFALCALLYLYLPGRLFGQLSGLEPQLPGFQHALAILYGSGFFCILYAVSIRLQLPWLIRLLPPLLGAVWLWRSHKIQAFSLRQWVRQTGTAFWGLVLLWAAVSLLGTLALGALNPHPLAAGEVKLSADMLWNVGNASSFQLAFPSQDIRFVGVRFHYHYLTELLVSGLSFVSGQSPFDCFFYYLPPVMLAAMLTCVWQMGLSFYQRDARKSFVFTLGLFVFGCASLWSVYGLGRSIFGNTLLQHLTTNINAQATALCYLAIFFVLFCEMGRRKFRVGSIWLITWLCSWIMLCMSKGPQAAILICSLAITMVLVLLFQKPDYLRAGAALLGAGGLFLVIYKLIFSSGANTSMHFNIFTIMDSPVYQALSDTTDLLCKLIPGSGYFWLILICVIHAFCMGPFQFTLWLRGLPADVRHLFRLDPSRLLANGAIAGGMAAFFLFWHSNSSQVYFALLALIFLDLLAVDQLDRLKGRRCFALLGKILCAVGVCSAVMLASVMAGSGLRQLGRTVTHQPIQAAGTVTADDETVALWLHEHSAPNAIFATNRVDAVPGGGDGISNVYSALSGRQAYMEGYTYAISNMGVSAPVVEARKTTNHAWFDPTTPPEEAIRLAREQNVAYLLYCDRWPGSAAPLAGMELCIASGGTSLYRVP